MCAPNPTNMVGESSSVQILREVRRLRRSRLCASREFRGCGRPDGFVSVCDLFRPPSTRSTCRFLCRRPRAACRDGRRGWQRLPVDLSGAVSSKVARARGASPEPSRRGGVSSGRGPVTARRTRRADGSRGASSLRFEPCRRPSSGPDGVLDRVPAVLAGVSLRPSAVSPNEIL
jgi:hypothetical protein